MAIFWNIMLQKPSLFSFQHRVRKQMRPAKKPWSEAALDDLMVDVATDVKARADAAREQLASDPAYRKLVIDHLKPNGFGLAENQQLIASGVACPDAAIRALIGTGGRRIFKIFGSRNEPNSLFNRLKRLKRQLLPRRNTCKAL